MQASKQYQQQLQRHQMQMKQEMHRPIEHHQNMAQQSVPTAESQRSLMTFQAMCQMGTASEVEQILTTIQRSMQVLNFGLEAALSASNIDVARYLLSQQAPIAASTAEKVLTFTTSTTDHQQIALFELLAQHGWTPNSLGSRGTPLLPSVVTNTPLLRWFLLRGANPNYGMCRHVNADGATESKLGYESCAALESASAKGDLEAVRMLFDAGAEIRYGYPLHYAAGALLADRNSGGGDGPTEEDVRNADASRIPIMQLLLERGADVNQKGETVFVAHHPIMYAVMAGAVERVRWLLAHGADPEAKGSWGSAAENAFVMGSEDMKAVMEVGIRARRAGDSSGFAGESFAIRSKPGAG